MKEIWKPVEGYESNYEISDHGRLRSLDRYGLDGRRLTGKLLKGGKYSNGYLFYNLTDGDGRSRNHSIHRLVANAFIPNHENKPQINHLDGDRENNHVSNLEWCTSLENIQHSIRTGLVQDICSIKRKVKVKDGEKTLWFSSMKDCAGYFGFKKCWLHNRMRKHNNTRFKYGKFEIQVFERGSGNNA